MTSIDASGTHAPKALLGTPLKAPEPASQLILEVARAHGVSPIKQFREMLRLQRGVSGVSFSEYYAGHLYRPELSREEKAEFIGMKGSTTINHRCSPIKLGDMRPFIRDKVMYTTMLEGIGLPTTKTQAVATHDRGFGAIPALRTVEAIVEFLLEKAVYPVFGKPVEGSQSVGSALLRGVDKTKHMIEMGNGKSFDLTAFAQEIMTDYPEGFIFQDAVAQHKALTDVAGPAVGTLRVVTVIEENVPRVLYTCWKVPSPKAMSDNYWQSGSMLGGVDIETGKVTHCVTGSGMNREEIAQHPVTGKSFAGLQVPHWDRVKDVAIEAHHLTPEFGIFGWDIAVGEDGPVIIECNANPFHALYQLSEGRGILNADMTPVFDKVAARADRLVNEKVAYLKAQKATYNM